MATQRQKKLAKAIADNLKSKDTKTAGELLEIAGYDKTTSLSSPGRTIEQQGVKDELMKLGISLEEADKQVGFILRTGQPSDQLKAADLTYKRLGGYAPEKSINVNVNADIDNTKYKDLKAKFLKDLDELEANE
jgi:hypothetical protein